MEGSQIGAYRIERQLGRGGFGVVYIGVDVRLGRRAAIKQLLPELSGNREIVERFFNEAKAAASISHPGIVEIYDVGWHTDGSAYFAMKLLEGESLAHRLRATGPMPVQLAATIARQVASALVAAHARGIVHRDLKPDNVILVPDDEIAIGERAVVLDFGIAKLFGDQPASQKTRTGMMMGTPAYMSPEQCRGAGEVDHRTDIYALGCILYEMLTGRPPFVGEGAGEVLGMHQFVEPPPARSLRADLPPDLEALVMRTLAKAPASRFAQMSELQAALQPFAAAGGRSREQPIAMAIASASHAAVAPTEPPGAHSAGARAANVVPHTLPTEPPAPSTFSAARGEVLPPEAAPRSRRGILVALVGLAVIGIAVAVGLAASRGERRAAAPADAAIIAATNDAAAVPEPIAPDAPVVAVAAPEASPPDAAAEAPDAAPVVAQDGYLSVTTTPGSRVLVDGADRGATPVVRLPLRPGRHRIALVHGDQRVERAIAIAAGKEAKLQHRFAPPPTTGPPEVDPPAPPVAELIAQANEAARGGMYGKALRLAEQALAQEPGHVQALTAAVIAACSLRDASKAKRYLRRLPGQRQAMGRQICLRNGVTID